MPEHGNWATIIKIEGILQHFTRMIDDIGLLPYSECLKILGLTTLIEPRARGDLIEVFKAKYGLSLINGVFNFRRSGINLVSKSGQSSETKVKNLKKHYISDRTMCYQTMLRMHHL